jgi:hypothetical protein
MLIQDVYMKEQTNPLNKCHPHVVSSLVDSFTQKKVLFFPRIMGKDKNISTTFLRGYRIMWAMVIFDLPVITKAERKAAAKI